MQSSWVSLHFLFYFCFCFCSSFWQKYLVKLLAFSFLPNIIKYFCHFWAPHKSFPISRRWCGEWFSWLTLIPLKTVSSVSLGVFRIIIDKIVCRFENDFSPTPFLQPKDLSLSLYLCVHCPYFEFQLPFCQLIREALLQHFAFLWNSFAGVCSSFLKLFCNPLSSAHVKVFLLGLNSGIVWTIVGLNILWFFGSILGDVLFCGRRWA